MEHVYIICSALNSLQLMSMCSIRILSKTNPYKRNSRACSSVNAICLVRLGMIVIFGTSQNKEHYAAPNSRGEVAPELISRFSSSAGDLSPDLVARVVMHMSIYI